jgi:hypothetical protein
MIPMSDHDRESRWTGSVRRLRRYLGLGRFPGRTADTTAFARTLLVVRWDGTSLAVPDWDAYEVTRGFRLTVTRASGEALVFAEREVGDVSVRRLAR